MVKAVEGRWSLIDRVTPAIQNMNRETIKYKSTVKNARKSISDDWNQMRSVVSLAAGALIGGGIIVAAKDAAQAARESIDANTKLYAVLHNVKGVTDNQIQGLQNYATALQNVGIIEDDTVIAGVQQVGTFQLQAATIKTLMPGMADLLAQQKGLNATQEDAVGIGNLLGKAMMGNTGALMRVGISFTKAQAEAIKYGNEAQRAAILAEVLQQNVGGVNEALAATDQGQIKQATNAIGDMKEMVGTAVLMIEGKFAKSFMNNLPQVESVVQGITNGIEKLGNMAGFMIANWKWIGPIILTTVGSLAAYKIATMTSSAATLVFTMATKGLGAAMKANPIGVVITLLGLLVLAGTYVVQNWEWIKLTGMNVWNSVVGDAQWAVNKYIDYSNTIIRVFKFAFDSIGYAGVSVWNGIIDAAQGGVQNFLTPINLGLKALGKEEIKVNFSAVKGGVQKPNWDSTYNVIPKVTFGGAKFGQDQIIEQTQKAQAERDKKNADQIKALNENTKALMANTGATDENTDASDELSGTLGKGVSVNMTAEQIADGLYPRLERHLYGTA